MSKKNRIPETPIDETVNVPAKQAKKKKKKGGGFFGRLIRRFFLLVFTVVILVATALYLLMNMVFNGPSPAMQEVFTMSLIEASATKWVPALAVGGVYKYTDSRTVDALGLDRDGFDAYLVATKLVKETPVPVLLSVGGLLSDEVVNGIVGHNDYGAAVFANIDVIPAENLAIGFEYKQGVDVGDGIENHDAFDGHVAWFATDALTLVGAYAYTGDKDRFCRHGSTKGLGVGGGFVLSVQYRF
jgi:hypothetical protein